MSRTSKRNEGPKFEELPDDEEYNTAGVNGGSRVRYEDPDDVDRRYRTISKLVITFVFSRPFQISFIGQFTPPARDEWYGSILNFFPK